MVDEHRTCVLEKIGSLSEGFRSNRLSAQLRVELVLLRLDSQLVLLLESLDSSKGIGLSLGVELGGSRAKGGSRVEDVALTEA